MEKSKHYSELYLTLHVLMKQSYRVDGIVRVTIEWVGTADCGRVSVSQELHNHEGIVSFLPLWALWILVKSLFYKRYVSILFELRMDVLPSLKDYEYKYLRGATITLPTWTLQDPSLHFVAGNILQSFTLGYHVSWSILEDFGSLDSSTSSPSKKTLFPFKEYDKRIKNKRAACGSLLGCLFCVLNRTKEDVS